MTRHLRATRLGAWTLLALTAVHCGSSPRSSSSANPGGSTDGGSQLGAGDDSGGASSGGSSGGSPEGSTPEAGSQGGATPDGGGTASGTDAGSIPSGLPRHMLMGWGENPDQSWAQTSGTKVDIQWCYLSGTPTSAYGNWYNGFNSGGPGDASWLNGALSSIDKRGFIPAFHLYYLGSIDDTGGSDLLTEAQSASQMTEYFTEFKVMMQLLKTFGKPVIIVLEGDFYGQLSLLVKGDSSTMAAVASTGISELQGLPNTIAGLALGYLAIRKSVGASNVYLGLDTPYYAAGGDIMNWPPSDTDPLGPHVDTLYSFFGPLGYADNQTGVKFDFSASCPHDADADSYTDGRDKWSPSDSASVNSPSINRYWSFLGLYHEKTGVPWVLHQVPMGNSQHTDTAPVATTPRSGYKDDIVEYLLQYESPASDAARATHLGNFASAGVFAMLFGFSNDGDLPTNDLWLDGKPFFSTHINALASTGGFGL